MMKRPAAVHDSQTPHNTGHRRRSRLLRRSKQSRPAETWNDARPDSSSLAASRGCVVGRALSVAFRVNESCHDGEAEREMWRLLGFSCVLDLPNSGPAEVHRPNNL